MSSQHSSGGFVQWEHPNTAFPERDWAKYTSKDPMWKMPYLEVIFRGGRGVEQGKQM